MRDLPRAAALPASGAATALLVGKNGGVKLRPTGRVDPGEILPTPDALPMRRQR